MGIFAIGKLSYAQSVQSIMGKFELAKENVGEQDHINLRTFEGTRSRQ